MRCHIDFSKNKKKAKLVRSTLSSHSLVFASMIRYDSSSAVTAPPELELFDTSKTDLPPQLGPTIMCGWGPDRPIGSSSTVNTTPKKYIYIYIFEASSESLFPREITKWVHAIKITYVIDTTIYVGWHNMACDAPFLDRELDHGQPSRSLNTQN